MRKPVLKRSVSMIVCLVLLLACLPVGSLPAAAAEADNEFAALRNKFYTMAVGGDYDPEDPRLRPMLDSINDTAQAYWDNMNKSPVSNADNGSYTGQTDPQYGNDYIFPEYPLGQRGSSLGSLESNSLQFSFQYLRAMALAYRTKGCELYGNQQLLEDIKSAIDYIYTYHFNPSVPSYGNWFSWQLGAPIYLGETLMLLYDEFTAEQIEKYATALIHYLGRRVMTGANETWAERVRMYAGILLEDSSWLEFVKSNLPNMLTYTTSGDGYYLDGGFVQHDNVTYNGGYGLMCLTDSAYLLNMLSGTSWEISAEKAEIMYSWIEDSYVTIVYNGLAMDTFRGREITRKDTTQPRGGLIIANAMLMLADSAPEDVALRFRGLVKGWFENDFMIEQINNSADTPWFKFPLDTAVQVYGLLDDDTLPAVYPELGTTQMNSVAKTVHRTGDWTFAVAMTSKRIQTTEIYDESNIKGWYLGNGATWLYSDDMTRYEGVQKPTIDWYRLPGATGVYGKSQGATKNRNSFAGGVENGLYGVSGMDFSVSANNLSMKKSWFMLDDEVVAIGSGISGTGTVETTLENLMLQAHNRSFTANGKTNAISLNGNEVLHQDISTLHIEGNTDGSDMGFYFPDATDLYIKSETRTGTWADIGTYNTDTATQQADYLTVWQSHGTNPTGGSYAYVLLPGMTQAQTAAYAEGSDIEILRQDNDVHAVYEKTTGTLGACFWTDGENSIALGGSERYLTVDRAAAVLVSEDEDGINISLSDPTQENNGEIILELNRSVLGAAELDEGVELLQTYPTVKLKFSVQGTAGESLNARLSFETVTPPPQVDPSAAVNLAVGKTATASANDPNNSALTPDQSVDGDLDTRWASGRNDDQWFIVDLGENCRVEAIRILWEAAAGKEYKIQISDDNSTWTDMVHETANTGAGWKEYALSESYTGRYVRMLGISRTNTRYGYSMFEFEVWGTTAKDGSDIPITAISLPNPITMVQGEWRSLTAAVTPANSTAGIGWSSSDESLLRINAEGLAVAMAKEGTVTVTAYALADESIRASCTVNLQANPTLPTQVSAVTIENAPETLMTGDTCQLTAVVAPAGATYSDIRWISSDPGVAIVNANGTVTAVGAGQAVITAESISGKRSDAVAITVADISAILGDVNADNEINVGDIIALKALILNENATDEELLRGDLDRNGKLNVADILTLKRAILQ